ncbi:MAG: molybdopterin converting factor subunit 1 [bacterium]|nr:molybdopterin converting factor subunit 1 [Candidatus Kapabacteria bacterium]
MARILYFGVARDLAGTASEEASAVGATTVAGLWDVLIARHPALASIRSISRVALDMQYATSESLVNDDAEVAIIPPVAGG